MTMTFPTVFFAVLFVPDILLVTSSRLLHCIRLVAIQGAVIGLLPLILFNWGSDAMPGIGLLVTVVLNVSLKAVVIPILLGRTMRSANVRRELEPLVGYSMSLLIVVLIAGGSMILCRRLPLPGADISVLAAPAALTTLLTGLFLIMSRRKALTQALGFLIFENGITAFGAGMMLEYGLLVELGILLDVFVLVFIMGIAVFRISREFQHIDSDRLNKLGDWSEDQGGAE